MGAHIRGLCVESHEDAVSLEPQYKDGFRKCHSFL